MPKVLLNKQAHMSQYFTEWIVVQKHRHKVTNKALGELLGLSERRIGQKLQDNQFTFDDFILITHFFKASDDDLVKLTKI